MRTSTAFTLIELLVVISIIAVLAAMLMPAIGMVRDSARSSGCASNMRQFAMSMLAYTNDNEGYLPIGEWNPLVQLYIDNDSYGSALKLARCPTAPARTTAGALITNTYAYTGVYWASWAVGPIVNDPNQFLFAWPFWLFSPHQITLGQLHRSTEKCLLVERWNNTTAVVGDVSWGVNSLNDQGLCLVHNTTSNFAFADGHVQRLQVTGVTKFSVIQWANDAMWRPYNSTPSAYIR